MTIISAVSNTDVNKKKREKNRKLIDDYLKNGGKVTAYPFGASSRTESFYQTELQKQQRKKSNLKNKTKRGASITI
tara:strand:+ start:1071 stop:1298 length:228 start_codon:yes stop_codon:yes gene_type:complete